MKRVTFLIIYLVALTFLPRLCVAALRPPAPQLKWKVGDSWKVRTWLMRINLADRSAKPEKGPPKDTTFEISRQMSTSDFEPPYLRRGLDRARYGNPDLPAEGYKCFEITVTYPKRNSGYQSKFRLYFRQDAGNLIRVLDISGYKDDPRRTGVYDLFPDPNGPIIEPGPSSGGIPFDFPDFTQDPNYVRVYQSGRRDRRIISQKIIPRRRESEEGEEDQVYEVTISVRTERYEKKIVQKWRAGDSWWFEARRYENGKLKGNEAVLLRPTAKSR